MTLCPPTFYPPPIRDFCPRPQSIQRADSHYDQMRKRSFWVFGGGAGDSWSQWMDWWSLRFSQTLASNPSIHSAATNTFFGRNSKYTDGTNGGTATLFLWSGGSNTNNT